jgi:ribonuclease E
MLDDETPTNDAGEAAESAPPTAEKPKKAPARKRTTKKAAAPPVSESADEAATIEAADGSAQPARKTAKKSAAKKTATKKSAAKKATTKKTASKKSAEAAEPTTEPAAESAEPAPPSVAPLFQAPEATKVTRRTRGSAGKLAAEPAADEPPAQASDESATEKPASDETDDSTDEAGAGRRKRRRGGRRRRKSSDGGEAEVEDEASSDAEADDDSASAGDSDEPPEGTSRRRRRRRRTSDDNGDAGDDPQNTVTRVRRTRSAEDEITAVSGSTRLEAKKQRRREGREAGRRRAPIVSEAEFLARRESVDRVMVIRQRDELTQIAVLEDKVLVEHYVARESQTSLIGNVYLGRVQNVLPSMEAAFVDIGKGRNAVLYAGEVNWSSLGHKDGQPRKIESVLSSGQPILVQVTKDPIGHKGARLTSQVSLAGRFLVYVPDGTTSGISRKLPDTERNRLKTLLKEIVPDTAGVIVRTAAEGASEDELTRDVERLKARWEDIEKKAKGQSPQLLYGEPDLTLKVVRDLFTEDFNKLVIEGQDAWDTVQGYVSHVAPDLESRLERYESADGRDAFTSYRIDEQIHKGLDRKVWLPSGGSLVIDRTEAMTVVDVNTGKFTGSGGNLEETVTKNNLEAAEEIVRQLRLRDIGGIIVVDFIDMVLESNRDLVLRRLVECLGRDRTRHQVAEVTSLGLVQMTRKRIGTGLLESFSHDCEVCHGRGVVVEDAPVEPRRVEEEGRRGRRSRGGRNGDQQPAARSAAPSPRDVAAVAKPHPETDEHDDPDDAEDNEELEDLHDGPVETPMVRADDTAEPVAESDESTETPESMDYEEPDAAETAQDETDRELAVVSDDEAPSDQDEQDEPDDDARPPAPPEPPRVVTRSRRRAASRPAGPPAALADTPEGAAIAAAREAGAVLVANDHAHDSGTPALHVPIKRRGRKR